MDSTFMKKLASTSLLLFALFLFIFVGQVQAFENPLKSSMNKVSSFFSSVKTQATKIYLRLPGEKSGRAVLNQSMVTMREVDTVNSKISLNGTAFDESNAEIASGKLVIEGSSSCEELYSPQTTKQDVNIQGELSFEGMSLEADMDMKMDGLVYYFRFNKLPVFPIMDLRALKNQWLKMDVEKMMEERGQGMSYKMSQSLTEEGKKKLEQAAQELFAASDVSKATRQMDAGVSYFVINVTIPDEAMSQYFETVSQVQFEGEMDETAVQEMNQDLSDFLGVINDITVEVWIDPQTFYNTKIEVPVEINVDVVNDLMERRKAEAQQKRYEELAAMGISTEEIENIKAMETEMTVGTEVSTTEQTMKLAEPEKIDLDLIVEFDKFDEPINFSVPEDARDFEEVMQELMFSAMGMNQEEIESFKQMQEEMEAQQPVELEQLTPYEKGLLEQYGVGVEDVIE